MSVPEANQRALSINAIRKTLPAVCPDNFVLMQDDNESAKLDPCLIDTVKKIYSIFFVNCPKDLSQAFYNFRLKDCSVYLSKKIQKLQYNAEKIATTVQDFSDIDKQAFILMAERIQDLLFVAKFVSCQHLKHDNHTCLTSVINLEIELKALRERVLRQDGDHRQSLAHIERIERELHVLRMAFEKDQFELITQTINNLDRDLLQA